MFSQWDLYRPVNDPKNPAQILSQMIPVAPFLESRQIIFSQSVFKDEELYSPKTCIKRTWCLY